MATFFDRVVTSVNKGVTSVSEGANTFVEKAKLNSQIEDLENQKTKLLLSLGNLVYNLHLGGEADIPQCASFYEGITNCSQSIAKLNAELKALESKPAQASSADGIVCECGFVNAKTSRFCSKCGSALKREDDNI